MAADVEIVVGAQDQATAILARIQNETRALGRSVSRMAERTEDAGRKMTVAFAGIGAAAAGIVSVRAITDGIMASARAAYDAVQAYGEYEAATLGLTDAQKALARQMQNVLAVDEITVASLMKQAGMMGVATEATDDLAAAALGLSRVTGEGLEDSLKKVNQALHGNVDAFGEVFPQIKAMATEEEKLAYILDRARVGLEDQAAAANATAGASHRAGLMLQNLERTVGSAIAPAQELAAALVGSLAMGLRDQLAPAAHMANTSLQSQSDIMRDLSKTVISYTTIAETMIVNISETLSLMATNAKASFLGFALDAEHALTVSVPAYANWFGENFTEIIGAAADAGATAFGNMTKNIADSFDIILSLLTGNFEGGISEAMNRIGEVMSRNLMEGFEAPDIELPEIPEREITDTERQLRESAGRQAMTLMTEIRDKLQDRFATLLPEIGAPEIPPLDLEFDTSALDGIEDKLAGMSDLKLPTLTIDTPSLQATESRLLTRGEGDDPSRAIARHTEASSKRLLEIDQRLQESNDLLRQGFGGSGLQVEMIA